MELRVSGFRVRFKALGFSFQGLGFRVRNIPSNVQGIQESFSL